MDRGSNSPCWSRNAAIARHSMWYPLIFLLGREMKQPAMALASLMVVTTLPFLVRMAGRTWISVSSAYSTVTARTPDLTGFRCSAPSQVVIRLRL